MQGIQTLNRTTFFPPTLHDDHNNNNNNKNDMNKECFDKTFRVRKLRFRSQAGYIFTKLYRNNTKIKQFSGLCFSLFRRIRTRITPFCGKLCHNVLRIMNLRVEFSLITVLCFCIQSSVTFTFSNQIRLDQFLFSLIYQAFCKSVINKWPSFPGIILFIISNYYSFRLLSEGSLVQY